MNVTKEPEKDPDILRLPLFQGYGIELEYMIVDKDTLNVLPATDKVMHAVTGSYIDEINQGDISWSNELALHVLEFKTSGPMPSLNGLHRLFQDHVHEVNRILNRFNGMLMPTAMHPWMDPFQETQLWPHAFNPIYETYNRIFDCRGHGWSNLQSAHINLPFSNDEEFGRLHAAIRVLLPIMSALAASSPIVEKKPSNHLDTRLSVYLNNSKIIPSITGKVIPEVASSQSEYETKILKKMYQDISPHDPEKILQYEWLNSRGAIARFERFTIEIRVLDVQECPLADLAIAHAVIAVLKDLANEKWCSINQLNQIDIDSLYHLFLSCLNDAENSTIISKDYLKVFGYPKNSCTAGGLWEYLLEQSLNLDSNHEIHRALNVILQKGTLASRIKKAYMKSPTETNLHNIYKQLCDSLQQGKMFY